MLVNCGGFVLDLILLVLFKGTVFDYCVLLRKDSPILILHCNLFYIF